MTGIVISPAGVTLAHGRLNGGQFRLAEVVHRPGADLAGCLADLDLCHAGPACVSLPRNRTLVRHFQVPAESPDEIEAMLPHLLAAELPLAVENFSWVWCRVPAREGGCSLVTAYVSRNDQLEAFLAPLAEAGFKVVNLVPESWAWARILAGNGGAGELVDEPVDPSFVIHFEGAPCLLVIRDGRPVFDLSLPGVRAPDPAGGLVPDGPDLEEARRRYAELFDATLPPPRHWPPVSGGDLEYDQEGHHLAANVPAAGLGGQTLLPPGHRRRCRSLILRDAALGILRLGLLAVLIWAGLAGWERAREKRHLAALENELATHTAAVAQLEVWHAALGESEQEREVGAGILQVLGSLQRHVQAPIYLQHLDFVQEQGITLRGGAPNNAVVLQMMESLAADPLWGNLRVMQLRSEKVDGNDRIHFVVEGRLDQRH